MSIYIDSILIFILCAVLFPAKSLDALHITCILFIVAIYCFLLVLPKEKMRQNLGFISLILCFFIPELSVFLPLLCYVYFYHRQHLIPAFYIFPTLIYLYRNQQPISLLILPLAAVSFYLAYRSYEQKHLKKTIHALRDDSMEEEILLKRKNQQLLESQDNQIYIATLQERNRIAREIHDNVGHMLSRSILQVGALLAVTKDETLRPHLETLKSSLDLAMDNIRNSVHDLHDESIDLSHAMHGLTETFTFCPVSLVCDVSKQVPKDVKYCFLAITKEALNNTMRHSNATRLAVTVKEHPAFYQLLIEDNGTTAKNGDFLTSERAGIGLSNMKERVDALHGIIHISATQGFRVFVSVPKE